MEAERILRMLPRLAATPAAPSAGTMLLYFKTDGMLYCQDENGLEQVFHNRDVDMAALGAFGGL